MGGMDCRCAYFLVCSYRFEPCLLVIDFFSREQAHKSLLPRLVEVACLAASLVLPFASFTTGSWSLLIDWRSRLGGVIVSAGSSFCWCPDAPSIFGWIGYGFVSYWMRKPFILTSYVAKGVTMSKDGISLDSSGDLWRPSGRDRGP
jgi:hypothetical protein